MAPLENLPQVCRKLVWQIDQARSIWLQRLPEEAAKQGVRLVNSKLTPETKLDMRDEDTGVFPFKGVDGETMEAAIIGLQTLNALAFAVARHHLADFQMTMDFLGALAELTTDKPGWKHAGAVLKANMIANIPVDSLEQSITTTLAHYLMADAGKTNPVADCEAWLRATGIDWLGGLTRMGAAMAFEDYEAFQEMFAASGQGGDNPADRDS